MYWEQDGVDRGEGFVESSEQRVSPGFRRLCSRFSRRGFLRSVTFGVAVGVAAVFGKLGVNVPPASAVWGCSMALGPCNFCESCVTTVPPDLSHICAKCCVCPAWLQTGDECAQGRFRIAYMCCN